MKIGGIRVKMQNVRDEKSDVFLLGRMTSPWSNLNEATLGKQKVHGNMNTIRQMEEKGNEMAKAHLQKPGLSSPAAMQVNCPRPSFPRADLRCNMRVIQCVLLVLFPFAHLGFAAEIRMELTGEYTYTVVLPTDGSRHVQHKTFSVVNSGCYWTIRTARFPSDPQHNGIEYTEVGYDGNAVYEVSKMSGDIGVNDGSNLPTVYSAKVQGAPQNVKPINTAVGHIYLDSIPSAVTSDTVPFWVAFGARCYFATNHTGLARQIWVGATAFDLPSTNIFPAMWTFTDTEPAFLKKITYFQPNSNESVRSGAQDVNRERLHVLVNFAVGSFTNVNGINIPLSFKLTRYKETERLASDPAILTEYDCVVQTLRVEPVVEIHPQDYKPKLPINTYVRDSRLVGELAIPVTYLITNTVWPTIDKVAAFKGVKMQIRTQAKPHAAVNKTSVKRQVTVWILVFFSVSLALLIAVKKKNKQTQKQV